MATTRIIPLHLNKGKTIKHCLSERLDYNRWQGDAERLSHRDKLCLAIDEALAKKPHDFEGFLSLMEQAGYTFILGKHVAFSHPDQKRNIRMRSLPEEYQTVREFIKANPGTLDLVEWALFDDDTLRVYKNVL